MASYAYFMRTLWTLNPGESHQTRPYPPILQPFAKDQHQTEARLSPWPSGGVEIVQLESMFMVSSCVFWNLSNLHLQSPNFLVTKWRNSRSDSHQLFRPSSSHTDELRHHLPICSSINISTVAVSIKQNHQRHELIHPPQHSQNFIPILRKKTPKPCYRRFRGELMEAGKRLKPIEACETWTLPLWTTNGVEFVPFEKSGHVFMVKRLAQRRDLS